MAEVPELSESDSEPDPEETEESVSDDDQNDVEEAEVSLDESDLSGSNDLFDSVGEPETSESSGESDDSEEEIEDMADGLEGNSAQMETAINEGAARFACVGLQEEDFAESDLDKDSLEEEFCQTFEAFRLGYFGSRALDQYILTPDDEEIDPAWGLLGSAILAAAMALWMRPDGDEQMDRIQEKLSSIGGGGSD
jgi:hypothetical protein